MTDIFGDTENTLRSAVISLEKAGYTSSLWDKAERETIGKRALVRAVEVLRESIEARTHPLGFVRIPLTTWTLDQPRIAVHAWNREWGPTCSRDIHDHCYDFVSICILGQIEHSYFDLSPSSGDQSYEASSYMAGCCVESKPALGEDQTLALVGKKIITRNEACSLHHNVLHQARPLTDLAVTVQFQSPCIKKAARVFRASDSQPMGGDKAAQPLSHKQFASLLESQIQ